MNVLGAVRLLAAISERRAAGTLDPTSLIVGTRAAVRRPRRRGAAAGEDAEQRPLTFVRGQQGGAGGGRAAGSARTAAGGSCARAASTTRARGRLAEYLLPALVRRARALKRDGGRTLSLGNDVVRDYLHVADVADAYLALAERGRPGEVYNVCSGAGIGVRQLAADVLLRAGVAAEISTDPSLVRATDIPALVGSPAKLMRDTGWSPRKTHADIIDDLLNAATD